MNSQRLKRYFKTTCDFAFRVFKGNLAWWKKQGLNCGQNVSVGSGTSFGAEPYLVTIHNNVLISSNVQFLTHDGSVHTILSQNNYKDKTIHKYGKIVVGDNSFIGANAIILPGVYIGKNCVIGAGSIVTRSIPDNTVAAGVPARALCGLDDYAKRVILNMPPDWNNEEYRNNMQQYLSNILNDPKEI